MTTISIVPELPSASNVKYRAIAGNRQSVGNTPGEALDAISSQLTEQDAGTLFVIQQMQPDRFLDGTQQLRLKELMQHWRAARDMGSAFSSEDQTELDQLVADELDATTKRASALLSEILR